MMAESPPIAPLSIAAADVAVVAAAAAATADDRPASACFHPADDVNHHDHHLSCLVVGTSHAACANEAAMTPAAALEPSPVHVSAGVTAPSIPATMDSLDVAAAAAAAASDMVALSHNPPSGVAVDPHDAVACNIAPMIPSTFPSSSSSGFGFAAATSAALRHVDTRRRVCIAASIAFAAACVMAVVVIVVLRGRMDDRQSEFIVAVGAPSSSSSSSKLSISSHSFRWPSSLLPVQRVLHPDANAVVPSAAESIVAASMDDATCDQVDGDMMLGDHRRHRYAARRRQRRRRSPRVPPIATQQVPSAAAISSMPVNDALSPLNKPSGTHHLLVAGTGGSDVTGGSNGVAVAGDSRARVGDADRRSRDAVINHNAVDEEFFGSLFSPTSLLAPRPPSSVTALSQPSLPTTQTGARVTSSAVLVAPPTSSSSPSPPTPTSSSLPTSSPSSIIPPPPQTHSASSASTSSFAAAVNTFSPPNPSLSSVSSPLSSTVSVSHSKSPMCSVSWMNPRSADQYSRCPVHHLSMDHLPTISEFVEQRRLSSSPSMAGGLSDEFHPFDFVSSSSYNSHYPLQTFEHVCLAFTTHRDKATVMLFRPDNDLSGAATSDHDANADLFAIPSSDPPSSSSNVHHHPAGSGDSRSPSRWHWRNPAVMFAVEPVQNVQRDKWRVLPGTSVHIHLHRASNPGHAIIDNLLPLAMALYAHPYKCTHLRHPIQNILVDTACRTTATAAAAASVSSASDIVNRLHHANEEVCSIRDPATVSMRWLLRLISQLNISAADTFDAVSSSFAPPARFVTLQTERPTDTW